MRLNAIIIRVLTELLRDKRTLALMFLAPLVILTLMYFIFNSNEDTSLRLGVTDNVPHNITEQMKHKDLDIIDIKYNNTDKATIENHNLDALITKNDHKLEVTYTNEDPSKTQTIKQLTAQALQQDKMNDIKSIINQLPKQMTSKAQSNNNQLTMANHYLYGDADSTYFTKMFPILMGFFVFFFVFLISGIALLRERTSGTLERLLATSVKRSELVFGYLAGYGLFAIIQTLIIVLFSIYLLKIDLAGPLYLVLIVNILLAFTALTMGIFVSTFANSEFQMIQFIPLIAVPQVFFSGIFPLENMTPWLANLGYLFPLRYAGDALTNIMIKGQGWQNIWIDLLVLFVFITIFTVLNIIGLKRYRKV
ncbi:ABC transporter permease [Staphylococcus simiae]|uniref:ABC transporter permease n=1 Tax=Staphylococcus simiae TaxID=308354 RepID=UPI001A95E0F4|nr:ABC transporter permease [Staphylococcus simiae]MBO1198710.1 ABC transporter permease [Staphylococcus simiae]MBO1200962.1 ABC transporter permease [Staphylococcus simiae]MBO1203193.1 ABC transporter permease [Staphylococcus simiae]MBO1210699.1 ABC transporter permease [Staphylococcus simiae]MBO1229300.1 ABC transporter permease [Staphylococcus simiae]